MTDNEMKGKAGLPQSVRLSEGLGVSVLLQLENRSMTFLGERKRILWFDILVTPHRINVVNHTFF